MSKFPKPAAGGGLVSRGAFPAAADGEPPPRGAQDDFVFAPLSSLGSCGSVPS